MVTEQLDFLPLAVVLLWLHSRRRGRARGRATVQWEERKKERKKEREKEKGVKRMEEGRRQPGQSD